MARARWLVVAGLAVVGGLGVWTYVSRYADDRAFAEASSIEQGRASREDATVIRLEQYLSRFPRGRHAPEARARVDELRDELDWQTAAAASTLEAYKHYLAAHPEGGRAPDARAQFMLLEAAQQEFRRGHLVYLYGAEPSPLHAQHIGSEMRYIRRRDAEVEGAIRWRWVLENGAVQEHIPLSADLMTRLTAESGVLQCGHGLMPQGAVSLGFTFIRRASRQTADVEEISNTVTVSTAR